MVAEALARLRRSGYSAVRELACEARDGWLVLRGTLPSHYLKQVALAAVVGIDGLCGVTVDIRVVTVDRERRGGSWMG